MRPPSIGMRASLVLVAALLASCGGNDVAAPRFESAAVTRGDLKVTVEASGTIEPVSTVEVKSKASGEILEMGAEIGDSVEAGRLLVRVDPRTAKNRVDQAQAEVNAAAQREATAKTQLERGEKLRANAWINQSELEALELEVANTHAESVAARVELENARIALEDTEVRAPSSGTILTRLVERGQVISSPTQDVGGGTPLLTMADLSRVRARVRVDETDIGKLAAGVPARIRVAAYPGREFRGVVEKIEPQAVVDQNVTMFAVLVDIGNEEGLLRPGMNVDAVFEVAERKAVLLLPVMALRAERDIDATAGILGLDAGSLREEIGAAAAGGGRGAGGARGRSARRRPRGRDAARSRAVGRRGPGWTRDADPGRDRHHRPRSRRDHERPGGRVGSLAPADRGPCRDPAADPGRREPPRRHSGTHAKASRHGRAADAARAGALMPFWETARLALDSMRGNAFRSALTMLGVIIGVAAVIAMLALGRGARTAVEEQLATLGADVLTVTTGMRWMGGVARDQQTLTIDDADALARDARHMAAIVPEQSGRQQVRVGARNLNIQVIGTLPEHARVNGYEVEHGRMFSASDDSARRRVAVLGGELPELLEVPAGSLVGATVIVKNMPFEVVGIYRRKGAFGYGNPDDDIYIPLATSRFRITGEDQVQTISAQVAPGADLTAAMVEIERVLRREHGLQPGRDNDFTLLDRRQFLATQQETTQILGFLLAGIAGVSLVVGGIGIMNIMLVTVTERTREIGIRKAIGATRGNILRQFLVEAVILCLLGGAAGVLLGIGAAMALSRFAGWQTTVTADSLALAFGFSAGVGLLFGLWPARRASRLDPIEALRHE